MSKIVHMLEVPAKQIPPLKYAMALKAGVKRIILTTVGGLGDQVVAEPTLRYALKLFDGYDISLLTSFPELFEHLPFKGVYTRAMNELNEDDWLVLHTNTNGLEGHMSNDFLAHAFINAVDFCSLCALQRQLPIMERQLVLFGDKVEQSFDVVVHPGRHWESKTFPKWWWDRVISGLVNEGYSVGVIGKDLGPDIGTVDVEIPHGCVDLRNKLSLRELVTVLQEADTVITNDSAPLHIAASGNARILFIASCKESDHLLHWRNGELGYKMHNLERDGLWNHQSSCPIRSDSLDISKMSTEIMTKILPDPDTLVEMFF